MFRDLSLHIFHASVAEFDGDCVANFVKRVSWWEGLSYYCQELFAYVGLDIFAVRWVEPGYFPIPILFVGGFVPCIGVKF